MGHSSAVSFLVFALCFVACFSESVGGASEQPQAPEVTAESAQKAVDEAKTSINAINDKAQSEVEKAKEVLNRVEEFKTKVDKAESQAEQALSEGEKAAKVNEEGKTLVENIKTISKTFCTSYQTAKDKVEKTNASLVAVLKEAEDLKTECDTEEKAIKVSPPSYADIITKAAQIKSKADALSANITAALTIMGEEDSMEKNLEKNVKEVQLKSLKVRGIVAVAKIKTMIGEAEDIITKTMNKKQEVNGIVTKMQTLKEKVPTESIYSINAIFKSANNELTIATGAVEDAEKTMTQMTQQKETAEVALTKVKTTNEVSEVQQSIDEAKEEVTKAEACVDNVADIVSKLTIGLKTAENSVIKANVSKQNIETALSTNTSAPTPEEVKETEKSDLSVGLGAKPDQNDTKIQQTITDTEQATSKDSPSQSNNSGDKLKETLIKGAQSVPTTTLTGGKAPAPGAKNDSAMTVSVPLLVALIASAALQ